MVGKNFFSLLLNLNWLCGPLSLPSNVNWTTLFPFGGSIQIVNLTTYLHIVLMILTCEALLPSSLGLHVIVLRHRIVVYHFSAIFYRVKSSKPVSHPSPFIPICIVIFNSHIISNTAALQHFILASTRSSFYVKH